MPIATLSYNHHESPRITLAGFSYIVSQQTISNETIKVVFGALEQDLDSKDVPDLYSVICLR
jgi:hypothetical protein